MVGVPWWDDRPSLQNNRPLAEKRLKSTERKLVRDPAKAEVYQKVIEAYLEKKDIRRTNTHLVLPNFPLYDLTGLQRRQGLSVMLPLNFREKFKTAKPCLDQNCRQTCLVSSLDFERNWSPALVGDVSQMYLELALTTEDRPLLRFLRRDLHQRKGARSLRILKICVWGLLLYLLCTVYKAEACR